MKKKFILFFLVMLFSTITTVNAGGNSDDVPGASMIRQTCVYGFTEHDTALNSDVTKYATFDISGISAGATPPFVTYKVSKQVGNGKLEEIIKNDSPNATDRIINHTLDYGTYFALNNHVSVVFMDNSSSKETLEQAQKDGKFCPSNVYMLENYKKDTYFMFCNGYNSELDQKTCENVENYIKNKLKHNNYKMMNLNYKYAISNIKGEDFSDTDAAENQKELDDKLKDICNPASASYNQKECNAQGGTIGTNAEEYTADTGDVLQPEYNNRDQYNGRADCKVLFETANGQYNTTWHLLKNTIKFMQYLAIALAIVLSIIDFAKVVPTQDKEGLNKAVKKSVMRVIIAIIIFFIPIILNFIMQLMSDIFNITDPFCGLFS